MKPTHAVILQNHLVSMASSTLKKIITSVFWFVPLGTAHAHQTHHRQPVKPMQMHVSIPLSVPSVGFLATSNEPIHPFFVIVFFALTVFTCIARNRHSISLNDHSHLTFNLAMFHIVCRN